MWRFSFAAFATLLCALPGYAVDSKADTESLQKLIERYATSIDRADTTMADSFWSNAPEVSLIHPLGEEHGLKQVEQDVYLHLMGETFSERKLTPKDISIQVYGDAAWSEFNWDFVAKIRKDGSVFRSQGRETQIYHRENGEWRLVHVHYLGVPITENLKGF